MATKIDFDVFGVLDMLKEKYGEALLKDVTGFEVIGQYGEITKVKVCLLVVRNPVRDAALGRTEAETGIPEKGASRR